MQNPKLFSGGGGFNDYLSFPEKGGGMGSEACLVISFFICILKKLELCRGIQPLDLCIVLMAVFKISSEEPLSKKR